MINILLIDDDEDEFVIFADAIRTFTQPMHCIYAQNADESFRILQNIKPDFIFVDMNMPRMNGIECIKHIKGMHKKELPLIVLYSTYIDDNVAKNAMIAGAAACLQKTNSIDTLVDRLQPLLELYN